MALSDFCWPFSSWLEGFRRRGWKIRRAWSSPQHEPPLRHKLPLRYLGYGCLPLVPPEVLSPHVSPPLREPLKWGAGTGQNYCRSSRRFFLWTSPAERYGPRLSFKEEQQSLQPLKTCRRRSGDPCVVSAEDKLCLVLGEVWDVPQSPPPSHLYVPFPRYIAGSPLRRKSCCWGLYIFAQHIWKLKFLEETKGNKK